MSGRVLSSNCPLKIFLCRRRRCRWWFSAFDDERALSHDARNRAHCCQYRSSHHTDGGQGDWNLYEGLSLLVLNDDALNVPFVDKFFNLFHQVGAHHLNFFYDALKVQIDPLSRLTQLLCLMFR